jgi:hypothetical protein
MIWDPFSDCIFACSRVCQSRLSRLVMQRAQVEGFWNRSKEAV